MILLEPCHASSLNLAVRRHLQTLYAGIARQSKRPVRTIALSVRCGVNCYRGRQERDDEQMSDVREDDKWGLIGRSGFVDICQCPTEQSSWRQCILGSIRTTVASISQTFLFRSLPDSLGCSDDQRSVNDNAKVLDDRQWVELTMIYMGALTSRLRDTLRDLSNQFELYRWTINESSIHDESSSERSLR